MVAAGCGLTAASSLIARTSSAQPPPPSSSYHLSWSPEPAPAECPDAEARLTAAVSERLGFNPFDARGERDVRVRLEREGAVRRLFVTFSRDDAASSSARRLESTADDCRVLLEAGSLAIALAIREELERVEAPPVVTTEAPRAAPAPPVRTAPPPPPTPPPRPPLEGRMGISLGVVIGALPKVAAGVDVSGRVAIGHGFWFSAGAIHVAEVSASDARFKVGLDLARAGACFDPLNSRRFDWASCIHASFGATYAVVQGLVPVAPGSSFVGGGSIGQWFAFRPVRPVALTVGAELGVPVPRYELVTRGSERAVFTVSPVTLCTFFGVMIATP